jgi:hypothetical protein
MVCDSSGISASGSRCTHSPDYYVCEGCRGPIPMHDANGRLTKLAEVGEVRREQESPTRCTTATSVNLVRSEW